MGMAATDKDQLWQLLQIVQKLEDTVTHTLTNAVNRRCCMDEIAFRSRRNQLFPTGYFADAAWDILLDLFSAHIKGGPLSTTALGTVGGVPQTTMLRYLDLLVRDGFAVRINDPRDGRRVFVELTKLGVDRMSALFDDRTAQDEHSSIDLLSGELARRLTDWT